MHTARTLIALAALLLAGCSDPAAKTSAGDTPPQLDLDDVEVETTKALGGLRGVVVDEAIRPIAGANLTLVGTDLAAVSDASGVFTFDNLEPGAYFIDVSAATFLGTQASAEVAAGQVTDVRVLLAADPTPQPSHETLQYDGFMEFMVPFVLFSAEIFTTGELNQSVCQCWWVFQAPGNVTTVVFELVFNSASPTGAEMYYQFTENECTEQHIHSKYTTSPYVAHVPREFWQVEGCEAFDIHFGTGTTSAGINQAFKSFVTLWRDGPAPEDWSISSGSPP